MTGNDQRINHSIKEARDTIIHANKNKMNGGFLDLYFKQGFDNLVLDWVFKVMIHKGFDKKVIDRLKRIYENKYNCIPQQHPGKPYT